MIYINDIIKESVVDGEGLRYVIFVQGCPHHCKGCHNQQTWNFKGGHWIPEEVIMTDIKSNPLLDGITFSGGEPFAMDANQKGLIKLADFAHSINLNVWCYTGYTFDEIRDKELVKHIDILVDGKYIEEKRCLAGFKGSINQNIIKISDVL